MSAAQKATLRFLSAVEHSGREAVEIALGASEGSAQRVLDALYRRGLVTASGVVREREQTRHNGRTFLSYAITETGRRRLARAEA